MIDDGYWRKLSACRDTDPGLFFPVGTVGPAIEQIENAKAVCAVCPVRQNCLEFALATNQKEGIWGGLDEEERRLFRRRTIRARREHRPIPTPPPVTARLPVE